jgi:cell division protein FtsN
MSLSTLHDAVRAMVRTGSKPAARKSAKQLSKLERQALYAMERRMLDATMSRSGSAVDPNAMWM